MSPHAYDQIDVMATQSPHSAAAPRDDPRGPRDLSEAGNLYNDILTQRGGAGAVLDVLVVEDDDAVRGACAGIAANFGCRVRTALSIPEARAVLAEKPFDLVLLDLRLPGGSGQVLFEEIRSTHARCAVVIMSAFASMTTAIDLMRNGAADFLPKPFTLGQLTTVLERAVERRHWSDPSRSLEDRLEAGVAGGTLVGISPAMRRVLRIISKVALTRHPVLITGERGAGKETVARSIHSNGPFSTHSFVPVDCDSLEPERLERELFGDPDPRWLTGQSADGRAGGLLTAVGNGTLFLDEVGALSPSSQARLLRTLEQRRVQTGGVDKGQPFAARVLASSSFNLERLVSAGRFRKDLFYRLNVVHLDVPPLRDRVDDIVPLAETFLKEQRRERRIPFSFSDHVLDSMTEYHWAGNVAELRALVEHACSVTSEAEIHFDDLPTQLKAFALDTGRPPEEPVADSQVIPLQELERNAIVHSLRQLNGDKILAARMLGIGKTTLYRKLKEYGIADDAA